MVKAPARLDWAKLGHINNHYIRLADDGRLADAGAARCMRSRETHAAARRRPALARAIPLVKDGAKTILELADLTVFVLKRAAARAGREGRSGLLDEETRAGCARLAERAGGRARLDAGRRWPTR